jgi:hypothetical protein
VVAAAAAQPPPRTEKARRLKCFLCRRRDWPDPLSELYHGAACGLILCFTCVAEVYSGSRNRGPSWRPDFVLEEILTNEVPVQYENVLTCFQCFGVSNSHWFQRGSGCGSGSSILDQSESGCESGFRSRILMTKNWKKFTLKKKYFFD